MYFRQQQEIRCNIVQAAATAVLYAIYDLCSVEGHSEFIFCGMDRRCEVYDWLAVGQNQEDHTCQQPNPFVLLDGIAFCLGGLQQSVQGRRRRLNGWVMVVGSSSI